ncbi:MAG: ATP-binding protein [Planctomycetota bacterium]|jgi:anti-sigma regulatory factor (Ser/Thr protein kinase)
MAKQVIKQIAMPKKTKSLRDIREFVGATVQNAGFTEQDTRLVVLAIDAAATSIILNAEQYELEGDLAIHIEVNDTRLKAEIYDKGEVLPIGSLANGEIDEFRQRALKHDLGIFLIRRIMHEVDYEYKRGFINKLTMIRFR